MRTLVATLTERGQVSVPAEIRRALGLRPGTLLRWERMGDDACRVVVERPERRVGAAALRGFARTFRKPRTTADWMRELRGGETRA